jgi:hypothetical protein
VAGRAAARRKIMTETPEAKAPRTPETEPAWHLSDEARHDEELYDRRADAVDEYESEQFGWALFAVVTLLLVGGFQIINGLIAFFRSGTYQVGRNSLAVNVDYSAWGWTHVILGALAIIAAMGLLRGAMWARILGIVLSVISAIVYMAFIRAFPALAIVVIAVDILVIYALVVHGRDLKDSEY